MKKLLMMVAVTIMTVISAQAQKIQVVDDDGNGIPLVSVLTESGTFIGTTDLNGVLTDVNGATKVALTHVAFKPQLVNVASLQNGRVTMESVDYGLDEVVVKPKPYVFIEYYFRGFSYIGDSLRTYAAGIIPVAYEIREHYKGKTRNVWSYGGAANKAVGWNVSGLKLKAEEGAKKAAMPIETLVRKSKGFCDYYKLSMAQDGNRWTVSNPEGVVGHFQHSDGLYRATLDGGKMQIYAGKVNGEKRAKAKEEKNYDYQYTEVYRLDDDGEPQPFNIVMEMNHWEHDSSKGRDITIIYLYAAEHSYMDEAEFKSRSKELNKGLSGNMTLDELQAYERQHNIPALAPEQEMAIRALTKLTGKK
jgi:hypothetical protein